eukprot:1303166-Pyramimonas_sp.AAC.1
MRTASLAACRSAQAIQQTLAASRNLEDCYPTIMTLHELHAGPLTPTQLKDVLELGGMSIKVSLTIDAESVFLVLVKQRLKEAD